MKAVLKWWVVVGLVTTLVAQTAPTKARSRRTTSSAKPAITAADVQALRDALAAQQQQIEQLRQQLQQSSQAWQQSQQQAQQQLQQAQAAATEAQQKAAAVEVVSTQDKDTVTKRNNDLADVKTTLTNTAVNTQEEQKRMSALEGLVGRFRFGGDVRVRGENFFQNQPGFFDRNRARIRVRFGIDGKLNEDFVGGIYLATGSLGDPTTTNETLTNFFDRKTIALDRGFITYNPVAHKWVSVTGGKFAYTWNRTSVTFDPDLNPEGFSEKFSFDLKHVPVVKNVTFQGIQMLFSEATRGADSFAVGGQVSGKLELGRWSATPSYTILNWRNVDAILNASAFAVQATTTGSSNSTTPVPSIPVPGEGPGCASGSGLAKFPPCAFAPNGFSNGTFVNASGKPHFLSPFLYSDFILNNQIKTGSARLPVNLIIEYEDNLAAKEHPLDSSGALATNLGKQSHAYLADISVGQTKNKNDLQLGYAYLRQEQDSVLGAFDESDQRAPTNVLQHRFYALWKLRPNTVAAFTWWHGRTLNTNLQNAVLAPGLKPGQLEPWLNRLQFDLIYSF